MINYLKEVLKNMPSDWLHLTTHRLDIYNESKAKKEFTVELENLYKKNIHSIKELENLPTAYDYIRLGHPLSCLLEWSIAKLNNIESDNVISFASKTTPILAILRTNLLENKKTLIVTDNNHTDFLDSEILKNVYNYNFEITTEEHFMNTPKFDGSVVHVTNHSKISPFSKKIKADFHLHIFDFYGSILKIEPIKNNQYISKIQHVRRRETIAMTPINCLHLLQSFVNKSTLSIPTNNSELDKKKVINALKKITKTSSNAIVASSGLSIQYAIMMGLIHDAIDNHPTKKIKFIVPPNCYGGTNDQARRVAECIDNVEIVDLPVDGENNMVKSTELVLERVALDNAVPYIIAEIPTNPRVEVPNLNDLQKVLNKKRYTKDREIAVSPVFILDQTFCPNVNFLGDDEILSNVKVISYASGSKFPSGGRCTAGYCVTNNKATKYQHKIATHLTICDNEATPLQYKILAEQLPSMITRIDEAYKNTKEFVNYIKKILPNSKINFVSEDLAEMGFKPSVFSLDLPTKGNSEVEKETYKRALNLQLINLMITKIPDESKFCVSYGQLKGCYWTIPATSTQGTTKEGDKDYIVRTSVSGNLNLALHKKVFLEFVNSIS